MLVMGIDPGISGAFVITDGNKFLKSYLMPIEKQSGQSLIDFGGVQTILTKFSSFSVFMERPVSFGMGTKGAFSYGRGFEALLIALKLSHISFTLIEPAKWTKEMHQGISSDLKPKVKSLIAAKRLYPKLVDILPSKRNGILLDGPVDALLIAGYGLRRMYVQDFY